MCLSEASQGTIRKVLILRILLGKTLGLDSLGRLRWLNRCKDFLGRMFCTMSVANPRLRLDNILVLVNTTLGRASSLYITTRNWLYYLYFRFLIKFFYDWINILRIVVHYKLFIFSKKLLFLLLSSAYKLFIASDSSKMLLSKTMWDFLDKLMFLSIYE